MLAFSVWNALWVVFVSFLFISVLMLLFTVIADLFRDKQLGGWAKAIWAIVLIAFPLLGTFVYLIARGQGMSERALQDQLDAKQNVDAYIREVAGGGAASELEKASALHGAGRISDAEYAALKAKILA